MYVHQSELHGHIYIIYVPIVMYGLRLFMLFYIVYQIVYMFVWSELEVLLSYHQVLLLDLYLMVSDIAKYIALGCLLLFYKNYIVY